jgi:hypothetical protein
MPVVFDLEDFMKRLVMGMVFVLLVGCTSFEATLAGNIDIESNTYELAMGYNKEDAFNFLAFGNIGFLLENPEDSLVFNFGLEYEHYFTDTIGLSGRLGYRHKQYEITKYYGSYSWEYEKEIIKHDGLMLQLGIPFSWSYGKITPFIGATFYDNPKFNLGISFALRNQAVAITLMALGAGAQQWNETGRVYDSKGRQIGTIYTRDRDKEKQNQEIAAGAIVGILGGIVEDKLPYPAWKWRPQYEGIYWEYVDGNISEITD